MVVTTAAVVLVVSGIELAEPRVVIVVVTDVVAELGCTVGVLAVVVVARTTVVTGTNVWEVGTGADVVVAGDSSVVVVGSRRVIIVVDGAGVVMLTLPEAAMPSDGCPLVTSTSSAATARRASP